MLYLVSRDREEVGPLGGAAIIATSLVLAVLTHHLVEEPVLARAGGTAPGRRFAAAGTVAVLLVAGGWQVALAERAQQPGAVGDAFHPGALAEEQIVAALGA